MSSYIPYIPTRRVTMVLLADGWHDVYQAGDEGDSRRSSFDVDFDYQYGTPSEDHPDAWHPDFSSDATGFKFLNYQGDVVAGPISSILAVKYE